MKSSAEVAWAESDGGKYQRAIERRLRSCADIDPAIPEYSVVEYDQSESDPRLERYVFNYEHPSDTINRLRITCYGKFDSKEQEVWILVRPKGSTIALLCRDHKSLPKAFATLNAVFALVNWNNLNQK